MGSITRFIAAATTSALLFLLPTAPVAAANLNPIAAEVHAGVKVARPLLPFQTDSQSSVWGALLSPLESESHLFVVGAGEGHSSVYAGWTDADTGRVQIFTDGQLFGGAAIYNSGFGNPEDWSYEFSGLTNSSFRVNYTTNGNDEFGAGGFQVYLNDVFLAGFDTNSLGYVAFDVAAGQTYSLGIRNTSGYSGGGGFGDVYRSSGTFDFVVTAADAPGGAVPEPATWAMLIVGFGMAGGSVRAISRTAARGLPVRP